jgi:hypothetical protein
MIYTYGDSFSYHFWITEEETYTHVLSQKLNVDYANKSFPAICHHETYQRLIDDLQSFQTGDIIVYQFTAGEREGVMIDGKKYFSSAGVSPSMKETKEILDQYAGGRDSFKISDDDIILLWSFCNNIGKHTISHKYNRVDKLLKFLEKTIGVTVVMLFLDSKFDELVDPERGVKFDESYSIMDWAIKHKIRLSDTPREGIHPQDAHPNVEGHFRIAEKIYEHLNKEQL